MEDFEKNAILTRQGNRFWRIVMWRSRFLMIVIWFADFGLSPNWNSSNLKVECEMWGSAWRCRSDEKYLEWTKNSNIWVQVWRDMGQHLGTLGAPEIWEVDGLQEEVYLKERCWGSRVDLLRFGVSLIARLLPVCFSIPAWFDLSRLGHRECWGWFTQLDTIWKTLSRNVFRSWLHWFSATLKCLRWIRLRINQGST